MTCRTGVKQSKGMYRGLIAEGTALAIKIGSPLDGKRPRGATRAAHDHLEGMSPGVERTLCRARLAGQNACAVRPGNADASLQGLLLGLHPGNHP